MTVGVCRQAWMPVSSTGMTGLTGAPPKRHGRAQTRPSTWTAGRSGPEQAYWRATGDGVLEAPGNTARGEVAEWSKAAVLKTVEGS